jgi:peptide deformylase
LKRDILLYPNPRLRQRCVAVKAIDDKVRTTAQEMIETATFEGRGIGLAANQIGSMKRIILLCPPGSEPRIYINPILENPSAETEVMEEGTLSLPGLRLPVERPVEITIVALNLDGERVEERLKGLEARIAMHENDHINGVYFFDRASKRDRQKIEGDLRRLRKK